jgi:hypothetical protein
MTVAELIQVLQSMPQDLVVDIAMNQEYQCRIEAEDVRVFTRYDSDEQYVCIGE